MATGRKVLFISAPVGAGHVRAARAAGAALLRLDPTAAAEYANVFDFFNPRLGKSILAFYLKVLATFPAAYGLAYGWGNSSRLALAGRSLISRYLAGRMERFIKDLKPAVIVVSHATPGGLVADLVRRQRVTQPVVAIVTDYVVHRLWVYPEIGSYTVANEGMVDFLTGHGIGRERCLISGIPVDERFVAGPARPAAAEKLGLAADVPTVLIMGGGGGLLPMAALVDAMESQGRPLQILAVAGANHALAARLAGQAAALQHCRLVPFGFVDNVHELMAAADCLITKPGGLTAAEATALGLPMIIYRPIPGQEEANTAFLTASGAAARAESPLEAAQLTLALLADPARLAAMAAKARAVGRPQAAETVARHILGLLDKSGLD